MSEATDSWSLYFIPHLQHLLQCHVGSPFDGRPASCCLCTFLCPVCQLRESWQKFTEIFPLILSTPAAAHTGINYAVRMEARTKPLFLTGGVWRPNNCIHCMCQGKGYTFSCIQTLNLPVEVLGTVSVKTSSPFRDA